jgi:N-acetylneuraminate synthase
MGANRIEKHFTLSREGAGLDDPIALEPRDFSSMVDAIRRVEESDAGAPRLETARAEIAEHDRSSPGSTLGHTDFIERVLGDGVKRLAPSEQRNYGRSNRSLHALERIEAGEVLSMDKIGVLRTEHHLRPGIHPRYWKLVEGVPAARRIPSGEGIRWQDLLPRS